MVTVAVKEYVSHFFVLNQNVIGRKGELKMLSVKTYLKTQ